MRSLLLNDGRRNEDIHHIPVLVQCALFPGQVVSVLSRSGKMIKGNFDIHELLSSS